MKKSLGIVGYLSLLISGIFLDAPIIALLAMLLFLAGLTLLIIFYIDLINREKSNRLVFVLLAVIGTILLSGTLGYAAVEYNQYLVEVDRNPEVNPSSSAWIIVGAINLIASLLIYFGIKNSSKLNKVNLLFVWLPTFVLIPLTIILMKLTVLTGIWFGG
jgi:hypothetical protein